ncbi:MAG TPA: hypothetical protein VF743_01300, partial [Acidimicrobiales bacterium]
VDLQAQRPEQLDPHRRPGAEARHGRAARAGLRERRARSPPQPCNPPIPRSSHPMTWEDT